MEEGEVDFEEAGLHFLCVCMYVYVSNSHHHTRSGMQSVPGDQGPGSARGLLRAV